MKTMILIFIGATIISAPSIFLAQTTQADAADAQASVVEKLEEIVSIRERIFEGKKTLADRGRSTTAELIDFEIEVIESKIDLAEAEGRNDRIEEHLKRQFDLFERKLASLEAHDRAGLETASEDIANARIDLLKVEIRLLRLPQD